MRNDTEDKQILRRDRSLNRMTCYRTGRFLFRAYFLFYFPTGFLFVFFFFAGISLSLFPAENASHAVRNRCPICFRRRGNYANIDEILHRIFRDLFRNVFD